MTKVKLCGLTRECDIEYANRLLPDYIGFVFAEKSRRYVSSDRAKTLKRLLNTRISPVGVFVNEPVERVALMLNQRIIDLAQLHGQEDEAWITVQFHPNVVAVAVLKEFSCLILAQGTIPGEEGLEKAREAHLAILKTELSAYEIAKKLVELGI